MAAHQDLNPLLGGSGPFVLLELSHAGVHFHLSVGGRSIGQTPLGSRPYPRAAFSKGFAGWSAEGVALSGNINR